MYKALDLAKYIVAKCINDGQPISNLQLQKILYYIQKAYLLDNKEAFSDEIEAWQFGPVVPDVYYHYCGFGAMMISNTAEEYTIAESDSKIINKIVDEKRVLDPWDLVAETHKKNGAWDQTYKNGLGNHQIITKELIRRAG